MTVGEDWRWLIAGTTSRFQRERFQLEAYLRDTAGKIFERKRVGTKPIASSQSKKDQNGNRIGSTNGGETSIVQILSRLLNMLKRGEMVQNLSDRGHTTEPEIFHGSAVTRYLVVPLGLQLGLGEHAAAALLVYHFEHHVTR